ncbi:MAG: hypothetical protein IT222_02850 [Crocinitomix sp.]|nr:hypothetical protein [Crocinitomix sp.]
MTDSHIQINTLGMAHFCIHHNDPIDILREYYSISNLSEKQSVKKIDWDFIYKENEKSKRFILLTDLNGWSYIIWTYWDFQENVVLATDFSKILKTTVNYYFVDSYIATSRWVFANNGILTRAYFESHGNKLFDFGTNEVESELRLNIKEVFVESIFWDLYEKTCQSLELVNRQNRKELKLYTGLLEDRKNN